jgi:deoxyribodipyrimidine photo-lyase
MTATVTPAPRILPQNGEPPNPTGEYVLYWMIAARRTRYNFGLQRAVELAAELGRPLLVLEAIRADYPFASDRFHAFLIQGMRDNARDFAKSRARYYPYVEPSAGAGSGLLEALAHRSAAVVTDYYTAFFLPRMVAAAARRCAVRMEAVDSSTLIPVSEHGRGFPTARGYRAFMQRTLKDHLSRFPLESPVDRFEGPAVTIPAAILGRWPAADLTRPIEKILASLPIDHSVGAVEQTGGSAAAAKRLRTFLDAGLGRYADDHNHPDADGTSRLSPYLHFGHLSIHELFASVMTSERWTTRKLGRTRAGAREGWWGVSASAEAFLDQITVWRELAFNGCHWTPGYGSYASLPGWARMTLEAHRRDRRPHLYALEELDAARTADDVWNAAQRQLRQDGWFHGYLRMLWGKKMLEWTREPAEVLDFMAHLMNRYSLDGRDPVSTLNYGWVLGQHDRPWPERPIFGTVRYMTSASTKRKLRMKAYLTRYGVPAAQPAMFDDPTS